MYVALLEILYINFDSSERYNVYYRCQLELLVNE